MAVCSGIHPVHVICELFAVIVYLKYKFEMMHTLGPTFCSVGVGVTLSVSTNLVRLQVNTSAWTKM